MFSRSYKRYVLFVLTLVYTMTYIDQGLIALLLEPIREDLRLSDSEMGLLTGIAFAVFYSTVGLPVARWSDRGDRVTISSTAIGLWGITVMSCLFVTNFTQMLFARIAAAVGESGSMPPTYSLLGDYFPGAEERTKAMSVYMLAGPLATLLSFILGGILYEKVGWRMTFFLMGLPAILVAILIKVTIAEPRKQVKLRISEAPATLLVLGTVWRQSTTRNLIIALILLYTLGYGLSPWYAAFMIRSHGMGTAQVGLWLGLIFGIGGFAGTVLGGYVVTRWFADDESRQMRVTAWMVAASFPSSVLCLVLPDQHQALLALLPQQILCSFFCGPTFALMQRLVASKMRATSISLVMLLANLIGMGIGPQVVGLLSDALKPMFGADSLRYAMLQMCFLAFAAAYYFHKASQTIQADLIMATRAEQSSASLLEDVKLCEVAG